MKYYSDTFWRNDATCKYSSDEGERIVREYNKQYEEEFNTFRCKLPKDFLNVLPLLHDARISRVSIVTGGNRLGINFLIEHNEFSFLMQFQCVTKLQVDLPYISSNYWLYDEILEVNENRFRIELIAFSDVRNRLTFEFQTVVVEGEKKSLPDGYESLDDYYNRKG